ncbi:hypothetical protein HHK36_027225 [Tetracentron sinense]|uniref:Uncharacterized protein n=1 Tax=Tetracentron sinense TaxID=13715 RepID=A0A834YI83_TETSI|nr:hypothetical protein HHK36_027225 [Tetracentron sinense]
MSPSLIISFQFPSQNDVIVFHLSSELKPVERPTMCPSSPLAFCLRISASHALPLDWMTPSVADDFYHKNGFRRNQAVVHITATGSSTMNLVGALEDTAELDTKTLTEAKELTIRVLLLLCLVGSGIVDDDIEFLEDRNGVQRIYIHHAGYWTPGDFDFFFGWIQRRTPPPLKPRVCESYFVLIVDKWQRVPTSTIFGGGRDQPEFYCLIDLSN